MGEHVVAADARQRTGCGLAARYSRYCVPEAGLEVSAVYSVWGDSIVQRGCEGYRPADGFPGGGSGLCHEPGCGRDSLPSRRSRRRQHGRLSLGYRTEKSSARDGAAFVEMLPCLLRARSETRQDVASSVSTMRFVAPATS